ncbi:MAG TPA: TonB-dependent receptor [Vicinamibacterales bacterium]|nr:TonB-dependent receptor [Vicinamibacterales bacterium]
MDRIRLTAVRGIGVLAIALLAPALALAQTGAATLTGIVSDDSGAAVPGATVTATNQATNVDYTATSNEAGAYTVTSLPIGTYVVKAELAGFKTALTRAIQLEAMQTARIDFKLELGTLQETVEVTGESPVLQTETATVGEVISGTTLSALPLNGRNTGQLSLLLPGVVTPNPSSFTSVRNFGGGRPFVNGNREQTNNYTIDGVDMNESIDNLVAYQPSPDALAEISVETNNYSADTGNVAGAVISNVIKSGTNSFRGNVFEFYRNSDMDANSWSNNRSSAPKPERRQDIFGGTLGGPLMQNRLFFFGNYQGTRFDAPGFETISVAPEAWRRGDLSSLSTAVRDPETGQAFPGNQIPLERISPVARAIFSDPSLYPLPNRSVSGVTGNYVGATLSTIRAHQADVRVDWNASNVDKIFGRFSFAQYDESSNERAFPLLLGSVRDAPFRNVAFNWNRLFKSSLVNELLVGYNQITIVTRTFDWANIGSANASFGIAGGQPIAGLSSLRWGSGLSDIGAAATDTDTLDKTYQINEKLTWLKGRHTMKFGGQLLHYVQRRFYAGNNGLLGFFQYGGAFTGVPFGDFLLDQVGQKGRGSATPPWTHLHNRVALFVQDDFKLTQALTLNLGLRWAYTQPVVEKDNLQSNFDLSTGAQILARDGDRESRALYRAYNTGFEPRLGFAFRPTDRWVVRGGYGITQYMEGTGANLRLPLNPPYFYESFVQYDATTGPGTLAAGFSDVRPLDQPSGQVRAWDPNLRPQFTQQWNVFAEYLLTPSMSANVGYVGHDADHLVTPVEGNQPLPGQGDPSTWAPLQTRRPLYATAPLLTNISTTASRGRSDYHALQTSLRQRNVSGFEYLASYTLSQAKTNNLGYYGSGGVAAEGAYWMNAYQPEWNYGPAFFDARHNFVFSANYELPFGRGRRWGTNSSALVNAILGGWRLSGIFQARSGFPITVVDGSGPSLQAVRGNERPNCVGDPEPANQTIDTWLDINAFARAPRGTWGNCPIGVARAPGYTNIDAVLAKRFTAGADRYFEFRAEAFNLTNTPSFGPPARDINAPNTFGRITSTVSTARTVELVLKFYF